MRPYHTSTLEHGGYRFTVERFHDETMGLPWTAHDGHGIVTNWQRRDAEPGELVLSTDKDRRRFYDVAASLRIARRDAWGVKDPKGKTKNQIAMEAVDADYCYLKAWCNNDWYWCGVAVTLLDTAGNRTSKRESLWGMESTPEDYLESTAKELADEIIASIPADGVLRVETRAAQVLA